MKIKYIGPLDAKKYQGITFPRLKALNVPEAVALQALNHPEVFMASEQDGDADVDPEVLALREQYANALRAEGQYHESQYQAAMGYARNMAATTKEEKQRRDAWIKGAQEEIDHGRKLQREADKWELRVQAETRVGVIDVEAETVGDDSAALVAPRGRGRRVSA